MTYDKEKQADAKSIEEFYDLLAPDYDAMTGFEKRFDQERPFFQALINRFHFRNALDAGCGSGFHSLLLSQLGVDVMGVDVSSEMLHLAERHARANNVPLRIQHVAFENLGTSVKERFAAVFVMGNSLAHLLSASALETALKNFATVLDPHGMLFIQILNYKRILARREYIQSRKQAAEKTFVRSYEYDDEGIVFNILTCGEKDVAAEEKTQAIRLRPVLRVELVTLLEQVGFDEVSAFGGISLVPFDAVNSKDLVVLATKRG